MKLLFLGIVFVMLLLIRISKIPIEMFSAVGYNSTNVPLNKINTAFENETETLTNLFNDTFKGKNDTDSTNFNSYGDIDFPFENAIVSFVRDFLNGLSFFKGNKIELTSGITRLYWKDNNGDRAYVFHITLVNHTNFMVRPIICKLVIKNIQTFLTGSESSTALKNAIQLIGIKLETTKNNTLSNVNGLDFLNLPTYHSTKNTLNIQ